MQQQRPGRQLKQQHVQLHSSEKLPGSSRLHGLAAGSTHDSRRLHSAGKQAMSLGAQATLAHVGSCMRVQICSLSLNECLVCVLPDE